VTRGARSSTRVVTPRQRQVVALIARGLTTKEIAHELRITERGVSAHISRLLAKFNVSNRAALIAHTLSEVVGGAVTLTTHANSADRRILPAEVASELEGFNASKFLVTVTLGRDPVFAFMNDAAARFMGVEPKSIVGVPVRDRFSDPSIAWWLEKSDETFRTGAPVSIENVQSRWLRDDGTWQSAEFGCVLQPVRDVTGNVGGMLWICAVNPPTSSSDHGVS
jgi:DNA-binding CsgD family transcriptional regulator